jgi:hypothetical protein
MRLEKTPAEQAIGKLFAPSYKSVQATVQSSENWTQQHRFYLDTKRGALRIESEDISWTLFRWVVKEGKGTFQYDEATLRLWGLHPDAMNAARAALETA